MYGDDGVGRGGVGSIPSMMGFAGSLEGERVGRLGERSFSTLVSRSVNCY